MALRTNRYLPNLRSTLSRLPKALKPYIKTTQQSVAFEPTADVWVDVLAFQQLAECLPQSASVTPNEQMAYFHGIAEQLQAMQQLYTGEFLDGLTLNDASGFSQWQAMQRSSLARLASDGLQMRGNTHLLLAEGDAAEDDFQQAYHLYIQSQNLRKAMNSLERLGTSRLWAADVEAAQSYYEQAIAMSNQLHDQPTAHRPHLYLARIIYRTGAYRHAEQKAQEARQFFEENGDRWLLTEVHYFLGKLYWSAGKYKQARAHYAEALQISRAMNAQRNQIICLARLGVTHKSLGAYQEALELMYQADALARTLEVDPVRSHILICIAETLYCAGQTMKSIAVYQEALECYAPAELGYQKVEALVGLASVLCHSGKNAAATAHLEELFATVESNLQQLHTMAEPFDTYLKFYRLLEACQDWRAPMVLEEVYALLQSWVAQVDHEQWQHSFLENIAANRELIGLYQEQETIHLFSHLHSHLLPTAHKPKLLSQSTG